MAKKTCWFSQWTISVHSSSDLTDRKGLDSMLSRREDDSSNLQNCHPMIQCFFLRAKTFDYTSFHAANIEENSPSLWKHVWVLNRDSGCALMMPALFFKYISFIYPILGKLNQYLKSLYQQTETEIYVLYTRIFIALFNPCRIPHTTEDTQKNKIEYPITCHT